MTATPPFKPGDSESPAPAKDAIEAIEATLAVLDETLEAIAERHADDTPQWEFCEGFMTALLCMRRAVAADEWLPALFSRDAGALFANESERTRFLMAWLEREAQIRESLRRETDEADEAGDDDALDFCPAIVDWRGMLASLPESERAAAADDNDGATPFSLGQSWAAGFLFAVEEWPADWAPPRDKEMTADMRQALHAIADLLKDDTGQPEFNLYDPGGPPSVSAERGEAFAGAIEGVYTLFDIAQALGPRVPTVRHAGKVGRNDPCPCGSGKKYKKCCG